MIKLSRYCTILFVAFMSSQAVSDESNEFHSPNDIVRVGNAKIEEMVYHELTASLLTDQEAQYIIKNFQIPCSDPAKQLRIQNALHAIKYRHVKLCKQIRKGEIDPSKLQWPDPILPT